MPVQGFGHFNLRAPRALLDRLRDFYIDVVGLEIGARPPFASHGYWLYAGGVDVLHLSEAAPGDVRRTDGKGTFDHAAFRCAGRAAYEARLAQFGIEFRLARVPLTGQVQLFFEDPAGNGVELTFAGDRA